MKKRHASNLVRSGQQLYELHNDSDGSDSRAWCAWQKDMSVKRRGWQDVSTDEGLLGAVSFTDRVLTGTT